MQKMQRKNNFTCWNDSGFFFYYEESSTAYKESYTQLSVHQNADSPPQKKIWV